MNEPESNDPLGWTHDVSEVSGQGLAVERAADAAERARIVDELDLVGCSSLAARYRIRAIAGGGYRLSGELTADVVQACVVTLEPVPAHLAVPFDVEYWPEGEGRGTEGGREEIPALSAAEIEPLDDGRIDAGRIVFEQLAASLDPYPRKPGAEFEDPAAGGDKDAPTSPFAVLSRLKDGK